MVARRHLFHGHLVVVMISDIVYSLSANIQYFYIVYVVTFRTIYLMF
jgi:hypothetical protein